MSHIYTHLLCAYVSLYDKTKARFGIYTSSRLFWYMVRPDRTIEVYINPLNIS